MYQSGWAPAETGDEGKPAKATVKDGRSDEAGALARWLRRRLDAGWTVVDRATRQPRPAHPGDVALLLRALTDVWHYEDALADQGFDYHTIGGSAFYSQQEILDVVNVLSVASLANPPVFAGYAASKAAAFSLTQALRAELAPKEIRVHGVFAGTIDTDMVKGYEMAKASPDVVAANIVEALAAGVEDIAPDPASRELFALWQRDPKAVERALAAMI